MPLNAPYVFNQPATQMIIKWSCNEQHATDKWEAISWARKIYDSLDIVYLDTETTGLHNAYPVEIAVLSRHGSPLLNTLVKPPVPSESGAERVHGITADLIGKNQVKNIILRLIRILR